MMFNFLNNLLNISMIFKYALFDDFDSMLLSSLTTKARIFLTFSEKNYKAEILLVGLSQ